MPACCMSCAGKGGACCSPFVSCGSGESLIGTTVGLGDASGTSVPAAAGDSGCCVCMYAGVGEVACASEFGAVGAAAAQDT